MQAAARPGASAAEHLAQLHASFQAESGRFDCRWAIWLRLQEIVFIGAGMDAAAISEQLDSALLNDEELKKYVANWASVPDPPHALSAVGNGAAVV